jgi:hypothetical protein
MPFNREVVTRLYESFQQRVTADNVTALGAALVEYQREIIRLKGDNAELQEQVAALKGEQSE